MPAAPEKPNTGKRSTVEFMLDLDAAPRAVSREIDLEAEPELAAALATAIAGTQVADALQLPVGAPSSGSPARLVSLPPLDAARSPEEALLLRRQRVIDRIATARDMFRLLGYMAVPEEHRKNVARMFIELETALGTPEGAAVKDPKAALAAATKEQLDAAEHALGPIEDRLLTLDDQVPDATFEDRVRSGKQNKKVIARYGRLLASRRLPAGPRRNRFAWLAMYLLTKEDDSGQLVALPPDRARNVLQHLIGGLPRKLRDQDTEEAISFLHDAQSKLEAVQSYDHLLASGLFGDIYGYQVSMREQLLSPEFVYASVLVDTVLRNQVERWITARERLHDSMQLTSEGTPREHMTRRLRAERDDVDEAFGAKPRALSAAAAETGPQVVVEAKRAKPAKKPAARRRLPEFSVDRRLIAAMVAVLVTLSSTWYVSKTVGLVGEPQVRPLASAELGTLSPLLIRGFMVGSSDAQTLRGWVASKQWKALDPRARHGAADVLLERLAARHIAAAQIYEGSTLVIDVTGGTVMHVEGGRL